MQVQKAKIKGSPYVGVYCSVNDKVGLIPASIDAKEEHVIMDTLDVETIRTSIASSSIIGVLSRGNKEGFIVPEIIDKEELEALQEKGVRVHVMRGHVAVGNSMAVNSKHAIVSKGISEKERQGIREFFNVTLIESSIAGSMLPGNCIIMNDKGFIMNPEVSEKELELLEAKAMLKGSLTTANYGDVLVGNSIIANNKGIMVGEQTSQRELLRIEEGLSGE